MIAIASDFDGGNIVSESIDGNTARLSIRRDHLSDFYQWFYFRVDGTPGDSVRLAIVNCGASAYPGGWPGYQARVSADNADWVCAPTRYGDGVLEIEHELTTASAWFAYFAPYSTDQHQALIKRAVADDRVAHRVLGQTLDGRAIDYLRIGAGPKQIWLYARQHPGETMAEWWIDGAIDWLMSDAATPLLDAATVHLIPNMNPDGSARGHLRTNAAGVNLNREWHTPSLERSPEVFHVRAAMDATGVDFAMDVHGDEAIAANFLAGFEGIPSWTQRQGDLYTRFRDTLAAASADFQTKLGYDTAGPGKANLAMSTNQLAERFGAVAMTLEMPFKDHDPHPDPVRAWSPERSQQLAHSCLDVLTGMIADL